MKEGPSDAPVPRESAPPLRGPHSDRPLGIFYFTQLFYPLVYGGGEYLFYLLARELAGRGHRVHVITQRTVGAPDDQELDGIRVHRVGPPVRYAGFLPSSAKSNFGYTTAASALGLRLMARTKRDGRAGVVAHSNTYSPAIAGTLCSTLLGVPHVVTFHDVYQTSGAGFWPDWRERLAARAPFYAPPLARLAEDVLVRARSPRLHAVSEATRDDLVRFGVTPDRITVIPNGVDEAEYHAAGARGAPPGPPRVAAYVGRLVFYKNLDTVIGGFGRVVEAFPDATLVLMGDGPDRPRLAELARPLGDRVVFKGRVSGVEKAKVLSEAACVVFPSLVEGFGISMIEAFASRKPVLVSATRPMSDIVSDGKEGYVLPPFDSGAWAERMIELFADETRARRMGEAAYRTFESKYKIERIGDEFEGLYRGMLACHR